MRLEDDIEFDLTSLELNLSSVKPIPRKRLQRITDSMNSLNSLLDAVSDDQPKSDGLSAEDASTVGDSQGLFNNANQLASEVELISERNEESLSTLQNAGNELQRMRETVRSETGKMNEAISKLSALMR